MKTNKKKLFVFEQLEGNEFRCIKEYYAEYGSGGEWDIPLNFKQINDDFRVIYKKLEYMIKMGTFNHWDENELHDLEKSLLELKNNLADIRQKIRPYGIER